MRRLLVLAAVGIAFVMSVDAASARVHRHRHHVARAVPKRFVFPTPEQAGLAHTAGRIGGVFETGILGPTTADPYERPGYGYYNRGYEGPGYGYPGY